MGFGTWPAASGGVGRTASHETIAEGMEANAARMEKLAKFRPYTAKARSTTRPMLNSAGAANVAVTMLPPIHIRALLRQSGRYVEIFRYFLARESLIRGIWS